MEVPGIISRVLSRASVVITYIGRLITPLLTSHEPPSKVSSLGFGG